MEFKKQERCCKRLCPMKKSSRKWCAVISILLLSCYIIFLSFVLSRENPEKLFKTEDQTLKNQIVRKNNIPVERNQRSPINKAIASGPSAGSGQDIWIVEDQIAIPKPLEKPSVKPVNDNAGSVMGNRSHYPCTVPKLRDPRGINVALASFPESGDTWIRYLVEQASGVLTGSIDGNAVLKRMGFLGESLSDGSVLMTKTHRVSRQHEPKFQKVVLLIRDLYAVLIANFKSKYRVHTAEQMLKMIESGEVNWDDFMLECSENWLRFNLEWLKFDGPLYVLYYQSLLDDLQKELIKLLSFLEIELSGKNFQCLLTNRDVLGLLELHPQDLELLFHESLKQVIDQYKYVFQTALRLREQGIPFESVIQSSNVEEWRKYL